MRIGYFVKKFSFDIKDYHREIRYTIKIDLTPIENVKATNDPGYSRISIEVEDKDYEFKKCYYNMW